MAQQHNTLRQEQQLKLQQRLNPQSMALGRLLEMSVPEYEDEVRRELDENPALEIVENDGLDDISASFADDDGNDFRESADEVMRADYMNPEDAPAYLFTDHNYDADADHVDAASFTADDDVSVGETLMQRLATEYDLSEMQMRIAAHIIGNFDDNGYLTRPIAEICDDIAIAEGYEPDIEQVRQVFDYVRLLDPPGIGAVDLRDCLLLQLDRMPNSVTVITAREIIRRYFDIFSKRHFDRLQAQLDIPRQALSEALDLIKTLNPKPASALDTARSIDRTHHAVPDFTLDYDAAADSFSIALQGNIPELAIEESFRADNLAPSRRADDTDFIKRKRSAAETFIHLMELRARTLMSIIRAIVDRQRLFFISGDASDIKPMILRDIASDTGYDISVVSRATSGKYILTPQGMYPLKMLFNERAGSDNDASARQILDALARIIAGEDKHSPLSDRELTELLNQNGYDLARRTVAKYRERLGLPVARLRRQM